ncbi:DNA cytosine methyltransferase [Leptospira santarosai]|uniref:DNA cytosine methyltransferase n=1 Tax=Leptospira santarosai TaxID=28183 RepID=UPI0002B9CCC6|nr:DNA cytosine methyltransferase [Leptospira santarosai]EMF88765.1 DNA (cytosine-5-)-methyltransferase [Leptospira santarosai str. ST188]EMO72307.1 DNA (cytosine-5-)-methyltransferase [Leptospira santarosai str. 200403458]EMO97989.1 DNA (cytosine-5-)-methyltransferase [Leptospira santarosai str. 200702252]MDI7218255.1 DNA cytosine methyltransferase [Leptospira santarosai]
MIALDFFCGAGGLTRGLKNAGIKVLAGIDVENKCKESYEFNNKGSRFINLDIRNIGIKELEDVGITKHTKDLLIAGCAPCQPFSKHQRKRSRMPDATLLSEFGRVVKLVEPKFILIENVPGLSKVKGYNTFKRFVNSLEKLGYKYDYDILDAKYFGVPQSRRRLVLLASKEVDIKLPNPIFGTESKPFRTVRDAIGRFPDILAGSVDKHVPNHVSASLSKINLERISLTPKNGGCRFDWPKHLELDCHKNGFKGHTDVYGRMSWDQPAPTLTGRCISLSNGRYGHPEQNRAISLREAASLQSFPDNYVFFGSQISIAQQIGNAVPVKLAEVLGKTILKHQQQVLNINCKK